MSRNFVELLVYYGWLWGLSLCRVLNFGVLARALATLCQLGENRFLQSVSKHRTCNVVE
jgi:hypothetical protein